MGTVLDSHFLALTAIVTVSAPDSPRRSIPLVSVERILERAVRFPGRFC